jgi:hypothetical protein
MIETLNPSFGAPGMLALGMEGFLIFLVIAGVSAVAEWLKKKRQREQEGDPSETEWSPPPVSPGGVSTPATGADGKPLSQWEEEIRRMLNGLDPQTQVPPPLPPPPPPIVRQAPPPVYQTRPVVVAVEEGESEEPVPTYLSSMERPDSAYRRAAGLEQTVDGRMATASSLGSATDAWNRAGSIDARVRARLSEASNFLQHAPPGKVNRSRSAEVEQLVAAFRNPATARQAFVASFVLGPPKALEN